MKPSRSAIDSGAVAALPLDMVAAIQAQGCALRHTINMLVNTQRVFYALASVPRRQILAFLSQTALSTAELAERFALSRPAISRHLSVPQRAGLVAGEIGRAPWR